MTLEEAIKHCEEIAELKYDEGNEARLQEQDKYANECIDCAAEHRQLAEWLKELKKYRKKNGWIPCSDRLPDPIGCKRYIVTMAHFDPRYTGRDVTFSDYDARFDEIAPFWDVEVSGGSRVVAWKPLPEPYRGEKE